MLSGRRPSLCLLLRVAWPPLISNLSPTLSAIALVIIIFLIVLFRLGLSKLIPMRFLLEELVEEELEAKS